MNSGVRKRIETWEDIQNKISRKTVRKTVCRIKVNNQIGWGFASKNKSR